MSSATETTQAVVVRLARAADAERIAVLSGQLGYPSTPEDVRRQLDWVQRDKQHAFYVAALAGDGVVGWIHVCVRRLVQVDLVAEIEGLVVDEACHRRGIGHLLIDQAEEWARERGCGAVYVRSNITRQGAHAFYRKVGYEHIKTSLTFHKVL